MITFDKIQFRRGDGHDILDNRWMVANFVSPDGTKVLVNYWDCTYEDLSPGLAPYAIERINYTGIQPYLDTLRPLWAGHCLLEMMCAIEHFQLTPEVEDDVR